MRTSWTVSFSGRFRTSVRRVVFSRRAPFTDTISSPTDSFPSAGEPGITSATLNVPGTNRTPRCPVKTAQLCGFGGRTHSRFAESDAQNPRWEASSSPNMSSMTRENTE